MANGLEVLCVELTLDMLQRRGVPLVNRCVLCQQCEESANHLNSIVV